MQKKHVLTINDSVYYDSDEQVDTINDSNKQVDSIIYPEEDTHIINRIRKWSVRLILLAQTVLETIVIGQDLVTSVW